MSSIALKVNLVWGDALNFAFFFSFLLQVIRQCSGSSLGQIIDGLFVLDMGVGGHLPTSQRSSPPLGGHNERPTDPLLPHVGIDIPALDVADRLRLRPLSRGPDGRLQEAAEPAGGTLGHPGCDLAHGISA
jgi:hypothetical protein